MMDRVLDTLVQPLVLPIAIAMIAGAIAYILSRWSPLVCRLLALTATAWVLAAVLFMLDAGEMRLDYTWLRLTEDVSFDVNLATTTLGSLVAVASAGFALLICFYSFRAMAGAYWEGKFHAYLLWALGGACIVALADNLLVLLVGWEIVTLMLFLMINQGRAGAKAGGAKAYGMLGFADACLLMAVAILITLDGGSANLMLSRAEAPVSIASMGTAGYFVYVLILIAALAKAGAIPLHNWIPAAAKDTPTPVMAYLPAALDKLLGIYLLATLTLRMFRPDWTMQVIMMVIGAVTILAAVLMAMMQHNLKRLLSFHAVSQVGYMVLGIGTGTTIGVIGGLFHMLNHAIYKCNLFLMSGSVNRASGTDEIEDMGGLARVLPVTFVCGAIAAAAISGVPPFNGFASKWLIYNGTLQVSQMSESLAVVLVVIAVFGSALTLASFVKVMYSAFLSPAPKGSSCAGKRGGESFFMAAPMVVLALACVVLGLWPQLVTERVFAPVVAEYQTSGQPLTDAGGGIAAGQIGLWQPAQATELILIGILLGLLFVWLVRVTRKVRIVRPFLAGEVPAAGDDRFRVPGTDFYETIGRLPLVGPLLKHGEGGAMDLYYWFGKYGHRLVEMLRAQHTGFIGLYVAWCLIGLTVMLVYLLLTLGI